MMTDPQQIQVGDELPVFVRSPGLDHWNHFAAVNDEFVPIHMDDEAGRAAGYPSAFGMGALQWAYLHNLLRGWLGDDGRIVSVSCQFRSPNLKGQTVTAQGRVTALRDEAGERFVDLEVWTEEQSGTKLTLGEASVAFQLAASG
jgi:acyl dehydratase